MIKDFDKCWLIVLFVVVLGAGGAVASTLPQEKPAGEPVPVEEEHQVPAQQEPVPVVAEPKTPQTDTADVTAELPLRWPRYKGPGDYFGSWQLYGTRAIIKAFPATAVSRVINEAEIKALVEKAKGRYEKKSGLLEELWELAKDLGDEPEFEDRLREWYEDFYTIRFHLESLQFNTYLRKKADGDGYEPSFLICGVIAEEMSDKVFGKIDELKTILDEAEKTDPIEPALRFGDHEVLGYTFGDSDDPIEMWFFTEGHDFYCGFNDRELLDKLEEGTDDEIGRLAGKISGSGTPILTSITPMDRVVEPMLNDLEEDRRGIVTKTLQHLGISQIKSIVLGVAMEESHFRETLFLELDGKPQGLLAALRPVGANGTSTAPVLPAPGEKMLELRGCLDVKQIVATVEKLREENARSSEDADGDRPPEKVNEKMQEILRILAKESDRALTGGFNFSISAPSMGQMVPQLTMAVGIENGEEFDRLLDLMRESMEGINFSESKYKEMTFTTVKIPNNPAPIVPCFVKSDDVFYLAQSPWTMKALIKNIQAQKDGQDSGGAAEEGEAAAPMPAAMPFTTEPLVMELTFDAAEIYGTISQKYLPMAQVAFSTGMRQQIKREPILELVELPQPDIIVQHLSSGRGGAAFGSDGFFLSTAAPLGDPMITAFMPFIVTFGTMGLNIGMDQQLARAERRLCRRRVEQINGALKVYRSSFGGGKRFPASLGELVSRGLVDDLETFRVPSDEDCAVIEFENEDGEIEELEVSYKYLPSSKFVVPADELQFYGGNSPEVSFGRDLIIEAIYEYENAKDDEETPPDKVVILYELNENAHEGRFLLCTDGSIYHVPEMVFTKLVSLK